MSSTVTKFEVFATWSQRLDNSFINFMSSMVSLSSPIYNYVVAEDIAGGTVSQGPVVYGILTSAQAVTALGYLNTLNTGLVANGLPPAVCISYPVTLQP